MQSKQTDLNAWMQYDGSSEKRRPPYASDKITYDTQDVRVGLDGSHTFDGIGTLSGRASYGFSSFNFPTFTAKGMTQSVNRADIALGWQSTLGAFDYSIGVGYDYFGFSKPVEDVDYLKADKNNTFALCLKGKYTFSDAVAVGADIDFTSLKYSSVMDFIYINDGVSKYTFPVPLAIGAVSSTMTEIHPYFRWKLDNLTIKVGAGVQIATGDFGENRASPDLRLDWTPSGFFSLWAQLNNRRVDMGTLGGRYDRNRYINPSQFAVPAWDKWHVEGGFIIGPFRGASIEVWGGTGKVSSWFAPTVYGALGEIYMASSMENGVESNTFMGSGVDIEDFTDIHYGVAVNYDYRDIASLRVSWEGAPGEFDKGYVERIDRARSVFAASLGVHPVKPLDVTVSYSVRTGRSLYAIAPASPDIFLPYTHTRIALGNAASLDLGATWRFSDRFNVWANMENLLNKTWQQVYGIPNKGVTGLVGVGFRF